MDYFTKVNYSMLKHITGTKGTSHTHQHTLQTPTKERNVRSESTKFIYAVHKGYIITERRIHTSIHP